MGCILLAIGAWLLVLVVCFGWFMHEAPSVGGDADGNSVEPDPTQGRGGDVFGRRG